MGFKWQVLVCVRNCMSMLIKFRGTSRLDIFTFKDVIVSYTNI